MKDNEETKNTLRSEELPAASGTEQQAQVHSEVLDALRRDLEAARYRAQRAERQYEASEPENRPVGQELERRWNAALEDIRVIESRIAAESEATASARRRRGESSGHIPKDIVEAVRVLSRIYSDEMSLVLPGFADLPIQRLPDLTPAAWVVSIRSLGHQRSP